MAETRPSADDLSPAETVVLFYSGNGRREILQSNQALVFPSSQSEWSQAKELGTKPILAVQKYDRLARK